MKIRRIVNEKRFRDKIRLDVFKNILKYNLNANHEKILIVGDNGFENNLIAPILTNAYSLAAKELGLSFETIYQNFKFRGDDSDEVLVRKLAALPEKSIIIINVSNRIGRFTPLGLSFRKYAHEKKHRFISSSSLGTIKNSMLNFVIGCLDIDYKETESRTEKLRKKLSDATEIHMSTKVGTDITFNVAGVEAKSATGIYRQPKTGGNMPGSEAYIAPNGKGVNGTVIIDGSSRIKDTTMLIKRPIKMDVKNGIITKLNNSFEANQLKETLRWAHVRSSVPENAWRIGELGIGTNKKAKLIGSTIIDEKVDGTAHVAIGSNAWFGGDIKSIIHLDQVLKDPIFKIDGKLLKY